jgi:hypothetical protein
MPPRAICLVILFYWVVASSSLIRRDILPVLGFVRPPDLRAIALAEENPKPSRWSVEVIDNPLTPDSRRKVGDAVTDSKRFADGWARITSTVWFDSGGLLLGTPFANRTSVRMEVKSDYRVDPSGNLRSFRATVKPAEDSDELLRVEGELVRGIMEIRMHGPLPILNQKRSYPYEPRSLLQNALGPFDRMPGLQVGQRWETRVVSPLTGQVEVSRVEVVRRTVIQWDRAPVATYEVVQQMTPLSARTWVRPDGLVLRQEVPFPFVKLVLERLPEPPDPPLAEVLGR